MYKKIIGTIICTLFVLTSYGAALEETENTKLDGDPGWKLEKLGDFWDAGSYICSIVVDSNNAPHALIYDKNGDNLDYWKRNGPDNWQEISQISNNGNTYADLAIDDNNNLHVCWFDDENNDLEYAKWTGSSWDYSNSPIDTSGNVGKYCSIATDSNNVAHVSYYDDTKNKLKYAKNTGGSWDLETVDSEGNPGKYSSIAVDSNNIPHIAYITGVTQVKYAKYSNSNWQIKDVYNPADEGNAGKVYPELDVGPNNLVQIVISYTTIPYLGVIKLAKHLGGDNWELKEVDSQFVIFSRSQADIKVDSTNNAHISYSKINSIKYTIYDGSSFFSSTIDNDYQTLQNSIYLDNENKAHVMYTKYVDIEVSDLCWVWYAKRININPDKPETPSGDTSVATGKTKEYTTTGTDPDGDQIEYRFDWGDGTKSDWTGLDSSGHTASMTHSWSEGGHYNVKAQTRDENGGFSDWSNSLKVHVLDANHGGSYKGFTDYYVKFNGQGIAGVEPYTYSWDFGDGGSSNLKNPEHTYSNPGSYSVKLTVTDSEGTVKTVTTTATIKDFTPWIESAINLAVVSPTWDGNHFHATIPFKNFAQLVGIDAGVPGDVNLKDFSGPYNFDFNWDDTFLKIDLYPNNPDNDQIKLAGSANVDIEAYDDLTLSTGISANFDKIGDEFNWELCFNINGRYEVPVLKIYSAIGPVPVSAEAKLHFDAGAEFCLNSPDEFNNHVFGSVSGNLGVGATVRGGIGVVGVASVGLYTDVSGSWNFRAPEQQNSLYSSFAAALSFGAYAELIFVFDWEWEWYHASWPSMQNTTTLNQDDWGIMPRNYNSPSWVNNNDGVLINNAFPMSHPTIGRNSNEDKIMVWAEDDLNKNYGGDGLDLWYSTWNNNRWGTRQRLTDDNLAQSNPSIAVLENGDAICVFNCLKDPIGSKSVIEAAKASEIGYCYWDGSSWTNPKLISDIGTSHHMDSYPVIKSHGNKAVAVWTCDDNPSGITVDDRCIYASYWDGTNWTTPEIIVNDNIISLPVSLSYNGNEASCAYTVDENGEIQNPDSEKQNIYITKFNPTPQLGNLNKNTIQITNDGINAHPSVNYINSAFPSITWMEENPDNKNVKILYKDGIGALSTTGTEIVFDGLDQGSSTSLFKSNVGTLSDKSIKPVIGFSNGKNLVYTRKFGTQWEDIQLLHMTDEEITQTAWDYDGEGDEISAVFLEKEKVTETNGVQMVQANRNDLLPPQKPYKPRGPGLALKDSVYEYKTSSIDPTPSKELKYGWDWGDGSPIEWSDWIDSGIVCKMSHSWDTEGEYEVRVKAKNRFKESVWSDTLLVTIDDINFAPTKPTINGQKSGKAGKNYEYTFVSFDSENENIQYFVDWGDGSTTGWTNPTPSSEEITLTHEWSDKGSYDITAKAKDINGHESGYSTFTVSMPKSKNNPINYFQYILDLLIDHFPFLEEIIKLIQSFIPIYSR